MHMSRDCCRGRQCGQWSVSPSLNVTSTPLCSPTSEALVDAKWSLEMPSYDHNDECMDCVTETHGKLQEAEKEDTLILENEDVLNTTVSSACNYVKPKKKRGERLTKDAISGSSAVLSALKHKVQSLQ